MAWVDFADFVGVSSHESMHDAPQMTRDDLILIVAHAKVIVASQKSVVRVRFHQSNSNLLDVLRSLLEGLDWEHWYSIIKHVSSFDIVLSCKRFAVHVATKSLPDQDQLIVSHFTQIT